MWCRILDGLNRDFASAANADIHQQGGSPWLTQHSPSNWRVRVKKYRLLPIKRYWTLCMVQGSMFRFHAVKGFVAHV
jgi:hypothetical protein